MENYALEMQKTIEAISKGEERRSLLLHSCCAPCSSSVLLQLIEHFNITVFYYNPNIAPKNEYLRRRDEQIFLLAQPEYVGVKFIQGTYLKSDFLNAIKGLEGIAEGGERCFACYRLRLEQAAIYAKDNSFDYFSSALSVSPHKNAQMLNKIGLELEKKHNVKYLVSDFKKKDGYKKSLELSEKYGLYRQDYCGCNLDKK